MAKQDFFAIRRNCYEKRILFEDPEFPANNSLLPLIDSSGKPKLFDKWMRPHEICENPKFFVNNFSRFDVNQGKIGDCWFLAPLTSLTLNPHLFNRVVCSSNSFDHEYAGIFHFHFWRNDKWESVIIDDRLPTYNNKLVYARSNDENEFWIALIEKAFAKFKGSYKVLSEYGTMCEAFADITGGISEKFCVKHQTVINPHCCYMHIYFDKLEESFMSGNFMGSFIRNAKENRPNNEGIKTNQQEIKAKKQLKRGHAFTITGIKRFFNVNLGNDEIQLLRLRNPWGSSEWEGDWCDTCPKWNYISQELKNEMNYRNLEDGEFWITYEDFQDNFDIVEVCSLSAVNLIKLTKECHLKMGKRAIKCQCIDKCDGNINYCVYELCKDPNCIVKITEKSTVMVSVNQTNSRKLMMIHESLQSFFLPMGLIMIKISEDIKDFCLQNEISKNGLISKEIVKLNECVRIPTTTHRFYNISSGIYIIVPYTVYQNAIFEIHIYTVTGNFVNFRKAQICMKLFKKLISRSFRC